MGLKGIKQSEKNPSNTSHEVWINVELTRTIMNILQFQTGARHNKSVTQYSHNHYLFAIEIGPCITVRTIGVVTSKGTDCH